VCIGGLIISLSVLLSKQVESSFGGYIASFPISFLININIIYYSSGNKILNNVFNTVPQGTLSLIILSVSFFFLGQFLNAVIALIISLLISCVFLFAYLRFKEGKMKAKKSNILLKNRK
jgi:hypothetical protein